MAFFEEKKRVYLRCCRCKLIFVPKQYWLNFKDEKARYDLHNNNPDDSKYRQFLSQLSKPLLKKLNPAQTGLDFGCGASPTLSIMLEECGHKVNIYDPFYYNDHEVLNKSYDFIVSSEVAEHMHHPNKEFTLLFKMLKKNGWLGVMTQFVTEEDAFSQWHYIRDLTHICFYSQDTFKYIAQKYNAELEFITHNVVLLKKL